MDSVSTDTFNADPLCLNSSDLTVVASDYVGPDDWDDEDEEDKDEDED